jgi:hypothetical protein
MPCPSRWTAALVSLGILTACIDAPSSPDANTTAANRAPDATLDDRAGSLPGTHRQYGTPVQVGNGMARSYIIMNKGVPLEIGIALSERALEGLPPGPGEFTYFLPLPRQNGSQYQTIALNWNPGGHPPPGIYSVPHFDFHFYWIPQSEVLAIEPSDPAWATKANNLPAPAFVPPGYVPPPPPLAANAVPTMGIHWIDPTSPEYTGQGFSRTFLYGSWDGRFIFAEPMITRAYLQQKGSEVIDVPHATAHQLAGYYPTAYRISWEPQGKEWHVALTDLTYMP